eukprot:TRINITY_DN9529_c0_g1_i1.p1 TRINITY_DN9529_c0_g1~~TRINITY_DN9529_c0_g1_i1.p1  ORF type:complete len:1313 (+),score=357.79 TRINITY_DN9529_c0_g1_i1:155-3940(+)
MQAARWRRAAPRGVGALLAPLLLLGGCGPAAAPDYARVSDLHYTKGRRLALREATRQMFQHAWQGYLDHAHPADELRPLSCTKNDNFGGYSLTVIDALDTLVLMGNLSEFAAQVKWLTESGRANFHQLDRRVSVFETNIRVLGGLVSAHLLADRLLGSREYNGALLGMAVRLAEQLLPAFDTPTGVPYNEINLKHGVNHQAGHVTCPAASGTLILEFGVLGAITGECRFIEAAHRAMTGTWRFRSKHNLVGTMLDINTGRWHHADADIGASVDSFYEYMLKGYIIFGDREWFEMWRQAKAAIEQHLHFPGNFYSRRNCATLQAGSDIPINSLQIFWPGLLVLDGDIEGAALAFRPWDCLFQRMGLIPEEYRVKSDAVGGPGYPLRPEMVESAWLLHRATGDPTYLRFGEELLHRINSTARTRCGYAAVKDVRTGQLEDKMDSYVLSETFKYLYLLFDPDPNPYIDMDNHVLTTEAHPIPVTAAMRKMYHQCKPFPDSCDVDPSGPRCGRGLNYKRRHPDLFRSTHLPHPPQDYSRPSMRDWERRGECPVVAHPMQNVPLTRGSGACMPGDLARMVVKPRRPPQARQPQPQRGSAGTGQKQGEAEGEARGRGQHKPKVLEFTVPPAGNGKTPAGGHTLRVQVPPDADVRPAEVDGGVLLYGLNSSLFAFASSAAAVSVAPPRPLGTRRWRMLRLFEWTARWAAESGRRRGIETASQTVAGEDAQRDVQRGEATIRLRAEEACVDALSFACPDAARDARDRLMELLALPPPTAVREALLWHAALGACTAACSAAEGLVLEHATRLLRRGGVASTLRPGDVLRQRESGVREAAAKVHRLLEGSGTPPPDDELDPESGWPMRQHLVRDKWMQQLALTGAAGPEVGSLVQLRGSFGGGERSGVVAAVGGGEVVVHGQGWQWAGPPADVEVVPDQGPPQPMLRFVGATATFGEGLETAREVAGALHPVDGEGCTAPPAGAWKGFIVMVNRGKCSFHSKAQHAEVGGAAALIVRNSKGAGSPETMTDVAGDSPVSIPLCMLSNADGDILAQLHRKATLADGYGLQVRLAGGGALDSAQLSNLELLAADTPDGFAVWHWSAPLPLAVVQSPSAWTAAIAAVAQRAEWRQVRDGTLRALVDPSAARALERAEMGYRRGGLSSTTVHTGWYTLAQAAALAASRADVYSFEWEGDPWPREKAHFTFRRFGVVHSDPPTTGPVMHSYVKLAQYSETGALWGSDDALWTSVAPAEAVRLARLRKAGHEPRVAYY